MHSTRRLLFVVNDASFFLSHRLPVALAARAAGFEVSVATPPNNDSWRISDHGFNFCPLRMHRSSTGILTEARSVLALLRLYRREKPDIVHHVSSKPVIYGGIAAQIANVPAVVSAVTGLGYIFLVDSLRARLLRYVLMLLYRIALRHRCQRVIFQNPDNMKQFIESGLARPEDAVLIRGSGVDLNVFSPTPESCLVPLIVLPSRMLCEKGVNEFVDAARALRADGVNARFALVGAFDEHNPGAIPKQQLDAWHSEGCIEWWGQREDMPAVFAESHIVCLPSYSEGLPRALIEAAACGRPIVTTDVPGCREIVRNWENGLITPVRDAKKLSAALGTLIESPALRQTMGARGRAIAEAEFSIGDVIQRTLAVYQSVLGCDDANML